MQCVCSCIDVHVCAVCVFMFVHGCVYIKLMCLDVFMNVPVCLEYILLLYNFTKGYVCAYYIMQYIIQYDVLKTALKSAVIGVYI